MEQLISPSNGVPSRLLWSDGLVGCPERTQKCLLMWLHAMQKRTKGSDRKGVLGEGLGRQLWFNQFWNLEYRSGVLSTCTLPSSSCRIPEPQNRAAQRSPSEAWSDLLNPLNCCLNVSSGWRYKTRWFDVIYPVLESGWRGTWILTARGKFWNHGARHSDLTVSVVVPRLILTVWTGPQAIYNPVYFRK